MTTKVLITRQNDNYFAARALSLPDIVASDNTESEAVDQLRITLANVKARSHVLEVDLPMVATVENNPWLRDAGLWADDSDWEAFQEAITDYRRELDEHQSQHDSRLHF